MLLGTTLEAITGRYLAAESLHADPCQLLPPIVDAVVGYGLRALEVPLDGMFIYPHLFTADSLHSLRRLGQAQGLRFTVHLPYMWLDLSSMNEGVRRAGVDAVRRGLMRGQMLAPEAYVLHLTAAQAAETAQSDAPEPERRFFLDGMLRQAARSLEDISQWVEPRLLCVENTPGVPSHMVFSLAQTSGASLCLDVGHLMLSGEDPLTPLERYRPRVRVIHLHDVAEVASTKGPRRQDHQPLGLGRVPIHQIWPLLRERSYEGVVILEFLRPPYLEQSLRWLRTQPFFQE